MLPLKFRDMVICDNCPNKIPVFNEYYGYTVVCTAREQTILPEPLCCYEIEEVVRTGECEIFSKIERNRKKWEGEIVPDDYITEEGKKRGFLNRYK